MYISFKIYERFSSIARYLMYIEEKGREDMAETSFVSKKNSKQSLDAKRFLDSKKGQKKLKTYRDSAIVRSLSRKPS